MSQKKTAQRTALGKVPQSGSRKKEKAATIIPAKKGNIKKYLPKVFGTWKDHSNGKKD